ncbi:TetR/AcrR family transcriptional regulator [Haliangium sp.]|uniref:TetR/AcrR family transcriptional regulator n=1 Tax=Haliangium sp. TaxID=2663208 RepID=UPI003D140EE6
MDRSSRKEREFQNIRRDILAAAARAFARRGYRGTTMEEVAKEAGYATSSLYTYFSGKEELYRELLVAISEQFEENRQEPMLSTLSFRDQFEWLLRKQFDVVERNREFFVMFLAQRPTFDCGIDSEFGQLSRDNYLKWVDYMADLLAAGMDAGAVRRTDPHDLAFIIIGVVNANIFRWIGEGHTGKLQDSVPALMEFVMHGVTPREVE